MSDDEMFERIRPHNQLAGCYKLGVSANEYIICMDGKDWANVDEDSNLESACKSLSPNNPEKNVCFSVSIIAAQKSSEIYHRKSIDFFSSEYNKIIKDDDFICYKPSIGLDDLAECLEKTNSPEKIDHEINKLRIFENILSRQSHLSLTEKRNGIVEISGEYSTQVDNAIRRASKSLENTSYKISRAKSQAYQDKQEENRRKSQERYDAEERVAQRQENNRAKDCGNDYNRIYIGMLKNQMVKCVNVHQIGAREGGVELFKSYSGAIITIENGKIFSWVR